MRDGADAGRAKVVEFWRTVELFRPRKVERVSRKLQVVSASADQPLPWEVPEMAAGRRLQSHQTWRHTVYLGIYPLDAVFDVLLRVYPPPADSYDERPTGESAVAAFVVDENGQALVDSAILSSCAWATGQVAAEQDHSLLSQFAVAVAAFGMAWTSVVLDEGFDGESPTPRTLAWGDLDDCLTAAVKAATCEGVLPCTEIRIKSEVVSRRTAESGRADFLNSFITADLELVAGRVAAGDVGQTLRDYLRSDAELPTAARIDVRERPDVVLAATAPDAVPAGRWPSRVDRPLALNQQLAVVTATSLPTPAGRSTTPGTPTIGVLGVNGPPGTGKTTMLRDLIAALVVERARRLADLSDPHAAFTGGQRRWKTGERTRVVAVWRPELTGYEMVVASSNNGAVQNVTDEIPAADAIDGSWREQAAALAYFPDIATTLLAPDRETAPSTPTAEGWALIAARLGNKANRGRFVTAFWYGTPERSADEPARPGLLAVLKEYEQAVPPQPWSTAVRDFHAVEARVEAIRAERAKVYRAVQRRVHLDARVPDLRQALGVARERHERSRARLTEALQNQGTREAEAAQIARELHAEAVRRAESERAEVQRRARLEQAHAELAIRSWQSERAQRWERRAALQQSRPGGWAWLRTFGAASHRWAREDHWLADQVAAAERELEAAQRALTTAAHTLEATRTPRPVPPPEPSVTPELHQARQEARLARAELDAAAATERTADHEVNACEAEIASLDRALYKASGELGAACPTPAWWTDRIHREKAALWTDEKWNLARSELFLAALGLHKSFLQHVPTQMRQNLQGAIDLVSGEAPRDLAADAALAAWQSLFFVVPVVSTTFSSYARLFGHLGREALGWLLVDEAGQATPQSAVGALWRSKRSVVVGDPLQLEPIKSLPFQAEQAIRGQFSVGEEWSPSRTSVQRLADRLTTLGTQLPDADSTTWVGVPLTVHRRCDQPMFDIVNTVAYGGLMIDGTHPGTGRRFSETYPTLPPSKWIDVTGGMFRGHWSTDEGQQLNRILETLANLDVDMARVMAVGPFRDIADELARRARRHDGLTAGTVHTAQGKQADVVILVLGGAPDRPGARRWAASKPNLLNVAVSRAKHRLYVIGDRAAWSRQRYFDVLANELPHSRPITSRAVTATVQRLQP